MLASEAFFMYSDEEIAGARELRERGLNWQPAVGHYCYDESNLIDAPSPFQENVYFILDLKHFLRRSETIAALADKMTWLPDWRQTRQLLRERGVSDEAVAQRLAEKNAIAAQRELLTLYEFLAEQLA